MPQIPLGNLPGPVRHVTGSAPVHGAPPSGYGMEDARAVQNFSGAIEHTAEKLTGSVIAYLRESAEAENRLAERECLTAYAEHENQLLARMAANPGEVEHFGEWAAESDSQWAETEKTYTDRMSVQRAREFSAAMKTRRTAVLGDRTRIAYQANATRLRQGFLDNFETNCARGDFAGAKADIDAAGNVMSPAEKEHLLNTIPARQEVYTYNQRIQSGDTDAVIAELRKEDKSTHLQVDQRRALLRQAEQAQAFRDSGELESVCAGFVSGNPPFTRDQLEIMHDAGELPDRKYLQFRKFADSYEANQKRAADYQASQQEKAEKASRQQQCNQLFADYGYDSSGYIQKLTPAQFAAASSQLQKICGKDYGMLAAGLEKLNGMLKTDVRYRDTPLYKDGELFLYGMEAEGKIWANSPGLIWDSKNEDKKTVAFIDRALRMDLENFCKDHPNATTLEMQNFLTGRVELYNKTKVDDIAAFSMRGTAERRSREEGQKAMGEKMAAPVPGMKYNGYVYTGGDPAKQENWKKADEVK